MKVKNIGKEGRRGSAPKPQTVRGNMLPEEIKPLVMAAQEAFHFQKDLGNIDDGTRFDDWRRDQVNDCVSKAGLSACNHEDFRPLMARFKMLAGKDESAFSLEMRSGKVKLNGAPDDTVEGRELIAWQIRKAFEEHVKLGDWSWRDLLEDWESVARTDWQLSGTELPFPGLDGKMLVRLSEAKAHIEEKGGPYREGYIISIVRNKTRRPDLNLGKNLWAGLAERCTIKQLRDLLSTIVNRIAAREGRGERSNRNKGQRKPQSAAGAGRRKIAKGGEGSESH